MSTLKSIIFETLPDPEEYYETAEALLDLDRQYQHFTRTVWKASKQLMKFDEINRLVAYEVEEKAPKVTTVRAGQDIPLGVRPGGYAEPLSGEWNAEQNTVLIPADEESEENTVPSYTQWFAVRMAAQHILYTIANNGDIHNGMTEAAFTDMTVTLNEDGSLKTSVANPDATAGAYTVKYYTRDELPKGLKLDADGSLSGTPAEGETFEGFSFVVRVLADDYVNFHYTVTIAK